MKILNNKRTNAIDISKYVDGFMVGADGYEYHVSPKEVRQAIDAISYALPELGVLPYFPATISPCSSSYTDNYLEHPLCAFEEYRNMGAKKLIGELKHMGNRSTILLFENEESAMRYSNQSNLNIILSRTGLRFFKPENEKIVSNRIRKVLDKVDYFKKYDTDFVLMDVEILPWNTKGKNLLKDEFIPVLDSSMAFNKKLNEELSDINGLEDIKAIISRNLKNTNEFKNQLENYCWDSDIDNLKIAPFHLLAHKNKTFFDKKHEWHLNHFNSLVEAQDEELFINTPYVIVDLYDDESINNAIKFWDEVTAKGYEGLMFKTETFIEKNEEGVTILPMMKVRGRNYLRIIYGINYDEPEILKSLRHRRLSRKRFLHYKQLDLAVKSLEKFSQGADISEWHDYIFTSLCLSNVVTDRRL